MRDAVGANGPRTPLGASGFRSNVSNWLGPPNRNKKIADFARTGKFECNRLAEAGIGAGDDRRTPVEPEGIGRHRS